ncbi:hypothetical protein JCM10212_001295 [Sporobolomyces blumeae]
MAAEAHAQAHRSVTTRLLGAWRLARLIPLLAQKTLRFYTSGPPHPAWSLSTFLLCEVARRSDADACADRLARGHVDRVFEVQQVREGIKFIEVEKVDEAAIWETAWNVKKRGLRGILEQPDAAEDGIRRVQGEWIAHESVLQRPQSKVCLFFHGGAYCRASLKTHRRLVVKASREMGCRVLSVDYRLSPETKYPGAILDAVSAYFHLSDDMGIPPNKIIVGGDSAGGNLAFALLLYLRDSRLPQLAGGVLMSPWVDLTLSLATWDKNKNTDFLSMIPNDPIFPPGLYASEDLLSTPYISPCLSASLSDLPPLLITAGSCEAILDEITLLAQRAHRDGVDVQYEIFESGVHVFELVQTADVGKEAMRSIGRWTKDKFGALPTVENARLDDVGKELDGVWANEGRTRRTDQSASMSNEERFLYEYVAQEPPEVKVRPHAHQAAVEAVEDVKRSIEKASSKLSAKFVQLRPNPAFKAGWFRFS